MRPALRFLLWSLLVLVLLLSAAGIAGYLTYNRLQSQLPDINPVLDYHPRMPLRIYSADSVLLVEIGAERRTPLHIDQIPRRVQQAFIAAEDARFYEHGGVDAMGIVRAAWANFRAGQVVQGASTITQQVARNFFLESDQTFERKLKEALLALKIEQHLSKPSILALYLNQIYLGNGAYGVQAAAQRYFGKDIRDLSLAQIALLAGLPKAPSAFNPLINPERALARRDYILHRMAKLGFISPAEAEAAIAEPLSASRHVAGNDIAPYATEEVRRWVVDAFGEETAYSSGLQVYTTILSENQQAAQQALVEGLEAYDRRHGYRGPIARLDDAALQAVLDGQPPAVLPGKIPAGLHWGAVLDADAERARVYLDAGEEISLPFAAVAWAHRGSGPKRVKDVLQRGDLIWLRQAGKDWRLAQIPQVQGGLVSLDAASGRILAMAGGYSFDLKQFNHVTQAWRQPGSAFKPFIYAAAMDGDALAAAGQNHYFTPASVLDDGPFAVVDGSGKLWQPDNYESKHYGPTRLRVALARSQNLVSIRLLQAIGLPYARDYVQRFGFSPQQLPNGLSLALGSASVNLLQMTAGYSAFATGGFRPHPYLIEKVLDAQGRPITPVNCGLCAQPAPTSTVLPPAVAFLTTSMMQDVVQRGTATAARSLERPDLAGKTGTTNESRDAWFIGFTPRLATGVWVGFDQPRSLGRRETGGITALPIWIDYMRTALRDQPIGEFRQPPDVVVREISPNRGFLVDSGGIPEYFQEAHLPPAFVPQPPDLEGQAAPVADVPEADPATTNLYEELF
ncbi:MAG: penicillin-binding protein 1A [Pseudomonadota bacterium]